MIRHFNKVSKMQTAYLMLILKVHITAPTEFVVGFAHSIGIYHTLANSNARKTRENFGGTFVRGVKFKEGKMTQKRSVLEHTVM